MMTRRMRKKSRGARRGGGRSGGRGRRRRAHAALVARAQAPAKGRDAPGKAAKGAEPKMVTVTYKEGDVLGEHLHAIGTLVEVKFQRRAP